MRIFGQDASLGALFRWVGFALVVGVVAAGAYLLLQRLWPGSDYIAVSQQLSAADRSQQLRMRLEGQYPGPLQDTIVQRWRDPVDGTVCYIYLPVAVAHEPGPPGLVQYGGNQIGAMSCLPKSGR